MALNSSTLHFLLIFFSLCILTVSSESHARAAFMPNTLVLPVHKDTVTNLHVTHIFKRTPLQSLPFLVDLNGRFLWSNCDQNYLSTTYRAPICHSTQCSRAGTHYCHKCTSSPRPGCHNDTCGVMIVNPITHRNAIGELAQDVLSIQSTQGSNSGPGVQVPQFIFACAPSSLLQGPLPNNVQGVAGLGDTPVALPRQLSSQFGFKQQFALCLTSSDTRYGVIFFGNPPYKLLPGVDVSVPIGYTPLTISPEGEYTIRLKSIRINNKPVPFNTSSRGEQVLGKTIISTTAPYTLLEHSIFKSFTGLFANQLSGVPRVNPVPPFGVCFNSKNLTSTRVGPGVPTIDLVVHSRNATYWRIFGANSMVQARPGVSCLGLVDGGVNPRASVVIGSLQLEDNLLQFDLARSRLGFSSSLLFRHTNCANFNFTSA
ncbi:hypothetical protein RJ639_016720 [Escallonia herrerae]|uniref:Peptidase A1 domain-containing protein n=1 Tax=Escallonia herrerae TaxID=1293975 RepID=A0AA88VEU5_9ASTE|nr:hypothetical protein RJ639_016720 [Escallonia herrerae]